MVTVIVLAPSRCPAWAAGAAGLDRAPWPVRYIVVDIDVKTISTTW
jgi:hypothetical protein